MLLPNRHRVHAHDNPVKEREISPNRYYNIYVGTRESLVRSRAPRGRLSNHTFWWQNPCYSDRISLFDGDRPGQQRRNPFVGLALSSITARRALESFDARLGRKYDHGQNYLAAL